MVGVYIICYRW